MKLETEKQKQRRAEGNNKELELNKKIKKGGAPWWLSQLSIRFLILAQVMISWFKSSSPASGSMLIVGSLLGILSLSLFLCPSPPWLSLSLKINKLKKINYIIIFHEKSTDMTGIILNLFINLTLNNNFINLPLLNIVYLFSYLNC